MNDLSQPCLVVVGGSSGIGLALALRHIDLGWKVVVVGSNQAKINELLIKHPTLIAICCDVSNHFGRQQLYKLLERYQFNRLIYAAGWYLNERQIELNKDDSERMLAINLQAFNAIFEWASSNLKASELKAAEFNARDLKAPQYLSNLQPSLICIASIAGLVNYPYSSLYAKCKRAMIATSSAYRLSLQPFGIRVNCIAMGYVNTATLRKLNQGDASHKPFIIEEKVAVKHIMNAIESDQELTVFPTQMHYIIKVLNVMPKPILNWVMQRKLDNNLNK